jgi:hypothetical protein
LRLPLLSIVRPQKVLMPGVVKRGHYFVTQYITGPQCQQLTLDFQTERIADPFVTAFSVCPIYSQPEDAVVRAAVLEGTDEANAEFVAPARRD